MTFSGIPDKGEQKQKCSPTKENKIRTWLPHPYLPGGPKEGPNATSTPRPRGSTTEGEGNKNGPSQAPGKNPIVRVLNGGPQQKTIGRNGPPCLTRPVEKSPSQQGTRSEVANKWPKSSTA